MASHHALSGVSLGGLAVKTQRDIHQFRHQLAAGVAFVQIKANLSHHFAPLGPGLAQLLQAGDAALAARAACLHAFANPDLLGGEQFVGLGLDDSLLLQLFLLQQLVLGIVAWITA